MFTDTPANRENTISLNRNRETNGGQQIRHTERAQHPFAETSNEKESLLYYMLLQYGTPSLEFPLIFPLESQTMARFYGRRLREAPSFVAEPFTVHAGAP